MTTDWSDNEDYDAELCLINPYSRVTCFILYLYSLEFGDPPLYTEINQVGRTMDSSLLETLGPFASALAKITYCAESGREDYDRIKTGETIYEDKNNGVDFNIAGAFLLWRGV